MPWRVQAVAAMPGYRLSVQFLDGVTGIVDMTALIESRDAGLFASLRDEDVFVQVRVARGAVTWPGDLDIAPDAMHAAIARTGEWKPA